MIERIIVPDIAAHVPNDVANSQSRAHNDRFEGSEHRIEGRSMITVPELAAEALGSFLATDMNCRFGSRMRA